MTGSGSDRKWLGQHRDRMVPPGWEKNNMVEAILLGLRGNPAARNVFGGGGGDKGPTATSIPSQDISPALVQSLLAASNPQVYDPGMLQVITPNMIQQIMSGIPLSVSGGTISGWGDGIAWGTRPTQSTPIYLDGVDGVVIENLNFDGATYSTFQYDGSNDHVCIFLNNCTNVIIRNCDFYQVSEPIAMFGGSNNLVEYNRTDGITGPAERVDQQTGNFIQTFGGASFITIANNKIIAMPVIDPWGGAHELGTEDVISLFGADDSIAEYNQIDATGYVRDFGTGTILGDGFGDRCEIRYNTYLNPGQVGIAIAGGFDHRMTGNVIYRDGDQNPGSGNTAAYYWDYNGNGIGGGIIQDNRVKWINGGGFWNPDGATEVNNNWDDDSIIRNELIVVM